MLSGGPRTAFMIFFELFFEIFSKEKPDKWIFLPSTMRRKSVHHRRSQVVENNTSK
jgi:hypothetical protein